ncbi:carbon-nitrogen hydrolase family protein [Amycolatopsis mongoliensis]|uniref:Carbon-nitrogen hydrolase family protein n=1 Tax=Amycolatopsis mongoliensis TaxID=715475 RepID=A0A9Y2NAB7_9PSEU|nr:carbon-nitrogen hydrolase family protein [Amycolatopsis sp. 4-36]WIX98440.1 carbon-nitrogen hydrolase family protein [Amycolatopsis sp. 4-36]
MNQTLQLAVAQSTVPEDPADRDALRASGAEIRALMQEASAAGARLVQFPEGAITYPRKYAVSSGGMEELTEADWSRAAWGVMREEAEAVADLAGELGIWTVFGSIHRLSGANRPRNSLYVVSDQGELVGRYDKWYPSNTEISYMCTPGVGPLVFEVDGFRFGCVLCIEVSFPELFAEYERLDLDCVLASVMVDDAPRSVVAQAYGTLCNYWVGYSVPAQFSATAPAGVVAPGGRWIGRCHGDGRHGLAVAEFDRAAPDADIDVAIRLARPWRRTARASLYVHRVVHGDPRATPTPHFDVSLRPTDAM